VCVHAVGLTVVYLIVSKKNNFRLPVSANRSIFTHKHIGSHIYPSC
jgi:hypothetical protein